MFAIPSERRRKVYRGTRVATSHAHSRLNFRETACEEINIAVRWRHGATPLARCPGDRGRSARRPRRGSTMPGFRSTRPRLPMLSVGAVAILILAACGDEAPPPTPTEAVVATEAPEVEETAVPEEATAVAKVATPEAQAATPVSLEATPVAAVATPVAKAATPVVLRATPIATIATIPAAAT